MKFLAKLRGVLGYLMGALFAGLATVAPSAQAVLDTSDITDAITAAGVAGAVVGAAVVVMLVGIKVFKWIRTAL